MNLERTIMNLERNVWMDIWRLYLERTSIPIPKSIHDHDYRVCSRHFVTGEPAKLYETNKPNWLPTLNLGHMKQSTRAPVDVERYERITERVRRRNAYEDLMEQAPLVVSQLVEEVITEESKVITTKELEIGREYIKTDVTVENTKCDRVSKIETLQRELDSYKLTVEKLTQQLNDHLQPFCEESFVSDEYTRFHTDYQILNY